MNDGRGSGAAAAAGGSDRCHACAPDERRITPVHVAVPGRLRLRVAGLKHVPALKMAIEDACATIPGVVAAAASVWSGTVLIHGAPTLDADALAVQLEAALDGLPAASPSPARQSTAPAKADAIAPSMEQRPWHTLSPAAVAEAAATSLDAGLPPAIAQARLHASGGNRLPQPKRASRLRLLLDQVTTLPVGLLTASAAISIATGGVVDAIVILGVVAANAAIGFATESEAMRTVEALNEPVRATVKVIRGGIEVKVPLEDVVVGDLQVLEPGSFVAADARIVAGCGITVDESPLTGESLPVAKSATAVGRADTPLAERTSMIYRGTALTGGSGRAIIVATGLATEIGRIQALIGSAAPPETPMGRQLDHFSRRLIWISGGICALVFTLGMARGLGLLPMLKEAISLAVAAVPEGLPTIATTTLALGIREMRRQGVLVRRFDAVETLGAVQVVCFDKTGTLTCNRMSVVALACGGRRLDAIDGGLFVAGQQVDPCADPDLTMALRIGVLCNEAEIDDDGDGVCLDGSPTEAALIRFAADCGLKPGEERARWPITDLQRRTEQSSLMRTTHRDADGHRLIAVKGAPEAVLRLCRFRLEGGVRRPLTDADRQQISLDNAQMAGRALRVLGFAWTVAPPEDEGGAEDDPDRPPALTWAGLVGMADPPRPGMEALMRTFHQAGIATVMITGDQSATAYALAKQLGLSRSGRIEILDSRALAALAPEALSALAQRAQVFARVSPSNKLEIVQALQRVQKVVAMTGDGINDGPALRRANVGIAFGHTGTDVAREVADVVLAGDDPRAIATAIHRGRVIFANVRKSLRFLLATNMTELLVELVGVAAGMGQLLTPMQLLWINLLSDVGPALALAVEPPEDGVMEEPPRAAGEAIFGPQALRQIGAEGLIISAGPLAACLWAHRRYGISPRTQTITFLSLITAQLLHAASCRSERAGLFGPQPRSTNAWLNGALAASFAVQGLAYLFPPLRRLLNLAPIGAADLVVTAAGGVLPFVANEALKLRRSAAPAAVPPVPADGFGDDPATETTP